MMTWLTCCAGTGGGVSLFLFFLFFLVEGGFWGGRGVVGMGGKRKGGVGYL